MNFIVDKTVLTKYQGNEENVLVPDGITVIGPYAFKNCAHLRNVLLPDSLERIDFEAFFNCASLEQVSIPSKVKRIDVLAFSNCSSLKEVNLCDGINEIGCGAFKNCISLKSISIPDSVLKLEDATFQGCTNLIEINCNKKKLLMSRKFGQYTLGMEYTVISDTPYGERRRICSYCNNRTLNRKGKCKNCKREAKYHQP